MLLPITIALGIALLAVTGALIWNRHRWGRERATVAEQDERHERRRLELEATVTRLSGWLESVPRLAAEIRGEEQPEAIGRALTNAIRQLLPDYRAIVVGRHADGHLSGLAGKGVSERFIRQIHESGTSALAAIAERPKSGAVEEEDWRAIGRLDLMAQLRGRVTTVPLRANNRAAGLLLVSSGRPEPVPSLHLTIMQALAGAAAVALAAKPGIAAPPAPTLLPAAPPLPAVSTEAQEAVGGLHANLEQAFAGITALLGTGQAIDWIAVSVERTAAAPHRGQALLTITAESLLRGLLGDASTIYLWEGDRLVLSAHAGLTTAQLTELVHTPAEAVLQVVQRRAAVPGNEVAATGHRAHLAVPIMRGADLLGVACIFWKVPHAVSGQDVAIASIFAGLGALALDNARLFDEMKMIVERSTAVARDREVMVAQFLITLGTLADGRQAATANHSRRVADYAAAIARQLGLPEPRQAVIRAAALVHDIGYLNVHGASLAAHPRLGAEMLASLPFLAGLVPAVMHHHEHFNGSGIPEGLSGTAIPLEARILAVANAFDVLTSPAAPKPGRIAPLPLPEQLPCSAAQALALIQASAGQLFDPQVVAALSAGLTHTALRSGRTSVTRVA